MFLFFVSRGLFQVLYFYVSFRGHTIFCLIFLATTFPCLSLHLFFLRSFVCEGVVLLGASENIPIRAETSLKITENPSKSPPNLCDQKSFPPPPRFWRESQPYVTDMFLMDFFNPRNSGGSHTNHQGPGCRSHQWASMNLGQLNDGAPEILKVQGLDYERKNRELQKLVGGWTNPFEKYARQNWINSPRVRDENKKYLSCHHPDKVYSPEN